jgi:predicted MFS family arabinose efflux permease
MDTGADTAASARTSRTGDLVGDRAVRAVFVAFVASGVAFASWVSRIPQVRDALGLDPGALGLVLLSVAGGSFLALPIAGIVVTRLGPARTILSMSILLAAGLATVAIGHPHGVPPVVVGLFLVGFGNGTWDVAMNVAGAEVEQHQGRSIMSRFHAGFSLGTVAGALLGSAMVALHVGVTTHLTAVAVVIAATVPLAVRGFLPTTSHQHATEGEATRHPLQAWTEPRTLLLGVLVLAMAFTEGTGNDWLGVAVIDGYGAHPAVGSLTFAAFVAAMTTGRWFGSALLDRYGRVRVLRVSALTALLGLVLVVFGTGLPMAMAGAVLWGLGAALGFPVGMSAAADDPRHAAGRVSVIASIGYVAFLAGPPLIGLLGNHVGVLRSLTIAAGLMVVGLLVAGASRPLTVDDVAGVTTPAGASTGDGPARPS